MNLKQTLVSLSLLTGILGIPKKAESYSTQTIHPGLVPKLIEFYKQTHETSPAFDSEEIKQGTINEDSPDYAYIRAFNHFHQWQTGEGILNFSNAESWAQSPEAQSTLISFAKLPSKIRALLGCDSSLPSSECKLNYPFGDHSWERAKDEFVSGKIERSFGHIFHLISDTTVPAHARNDPHWGDAPFLEKILAMYYSEGAALWPSDVYEVWTSEHANELLPQINPQKIPLVDNLQELFDELSYFTGSNFYSDGAVDGSVDGLTEITEGKKKYLVKPVEGKQVHVLRKGFFSDFPDVACLQDEWKVLGTKSVEYGAAAVEILINETASGCVDKCGYANQIGCSGNDVAVCADYNKDGCLEWVEPYPCGQGYKCLEGECIASGCTPDEWPCADGTCIPTAYLCDGGKDCTGGEDEDGCGCLGTNDCIYDGAKGCFDDGWKECGDFDGDNCMEWGNYHACGADEECSWGECTTKSEWPDCSDMWWCDENDEKFPSLCVPINTSSICKGQCLPQSYLCDNVKDCSQGVDEDNCCGLYNQKACESNTLKKIDSCGNSLSGDGGLDCGSKTCIDMGDGNADCVEKSCKEGNSVYWFNNAVGYILAEDCGDKSCMGGECTNCISQAYKKCVTGDYGGIESWWFDNCDNQEGFYNSCSQKCQDGECVDEPYDPCNPKYDHLVCSEGDVYWADACDKKNFMAEDCFNDQICKEEKCWCTTDASCHVSDKICQTSTGNCFDTPSPLCNGASCAQVGIYVYDNGSEEDDIFGLEIKNAFYGETPAGGGKEWTVPMVDGQTYEMLLYGIGVPDGIGTYAIELANAVKVDGPPLNGSNLDDGMSFVWHIKAKK